MNPKVFSSSASLPEEVVRLYSVINIVDSRRICDRIYFPVRYLSTIKLSFQLYLFGRR